MKNKKDIKLTKILRKALRMSPPYSIGETSGRELELYLKLGILKSI